MFAIKKIDKVTGKEILFDKRYNSTDEAQEILIRFFNLRKNHNVIDELTLENNNSKIMVIPV